MAFSAIGGGFGGFTPNPSVRMSIAQSPALTRTSAKGAVVASRNGAAGYPPLIPGEPMTPDRTLGPHGRFGPGSFDPNSSNYFPPTADTDFFNSHLGTHFTPTDTTYPPFVDQPGRIPAPPGPIQPDTAPPPLLGNLDDDIPPADLFDPYATPTPSPTRVATNPPNPPVLPRDPGSDAGPGLFPAPARQPLPGPASSWTYQPPVTQLPWWAGFTPDLGSDLFTNVGPLGFGTRPGPGQIDIGTPSIGYVNPNGDVWNGTDWTKGSPGPTNIVPGPGRTNPGYIDPATGLPSQQPTYIAYNPPSSPGRTGNTGPGGGRTGGIGWDPNNSPGSTAGFFDPLFGDSTPALAPSAAQLARMFPYAAMI